MTSLTSVGRWCDWGTFVSMVAEDEGWKLQPNPLSYGCPGAEVCSFLSSKSS